jgi:hypothetical protein
LSRKCRGISPETRNLGLFNFNGRILVAHDLLDEYTSAYTSSETPFVAWVAVVTRRYEIHLSEKPFLGEDMFRAVWFSYARLQQLKGDMECPECGPTPETVIWDGVTLAFSRKHLLSSLRPPTTLDTHSVTRDTCRYQGQQQLLSDTTLRKLVRKIIVAPPLPNDTPGDVEEEDEEEVPSRKEKDTSSAHKGGSKGKNGGQAAAAAIAHIEAIDQACEQLGNINEGLAVLFTEHYGFEAFSKRSKAPSVFRELFVQVRVL